MSFQCQRNSKHACFYRMYRSANWFLIAIASWPSQFISTITGAAWCCSAASAKSETPTSTVTAIGNHGQTVFHQPLYDSPYHAKLGDANIIAAKTEIQTVADFRRKDMALGGQGAPLVPCFSSYYFFNRNRAQLWWLNHWWHIELVLRPNQPNDGSIVSAQQYVDGCQISTSAE